MRQLDFENLPAESSHIEYKECADKLPSSLWETYSSFANTDGGIIVLGVKESKSKRVVLGVKHVDSILRDFWNTVMNKGKVSYNGLTNEDVMLEELGNKTVILINIHEAPIDKKPVYLNENPRLAYIRSYEGDHLVTADQLRAFMRNSSDSQDNVLLSNYTADDLHMGTVEQYRRILSLRSGDEKYLTMPDELFLQTIGAMQMDRSTDRKYKLTEGGLLFFGTDEAILSRYPYFHVDYFDRRGSAERWKDRVSSGDINYPNMNLLSYYLIVLEKLKETLRDSFELDANLVRKSTKSLEIALREALMNMIVHADYHDSNTALVVNVCDGYYTFMNPGMLRVSKEEFFRGGKSNPRNNVIITLFRRAGLAERAGSGGAKIFESATRNRFKFPEMDTSLEKTVLKIWSVDVADAQSNLSAEARTILKYMDECMEMVSSTQIISDTGLSKYYVGKALRELMEQKLIQATPGTRTRRYFKCVTMLEAFAKFQDVTKAVQGIMFNQKKVTT